MRSTTSSIASSRCETERRRRVSRSMSAADGRFRRSHRELLGLGGLLASIESMTDGARQQGVFEHVRERPTEPILGQVDESLPETGPVVVVLCHDLSRRISEPMRQAPGRRAAPKCSRAAGAALEFSPAWDRRRRRSDHGAADASCTLASRSPTSG